MSWLATLQRFLGLTPDGVFGETTYETIFKTIDNPYYDVPSDKLPPIEPKPPAEKPGKYIVHDGILYRGNQEVSWKRSPNVGGWIYPTLIVIHYTGDNGTGGLEWLCNPESKVSAHLWISKSGVVWQLVDFDHRAWHAGVSSWEGYQQGNSVNGFSIGIELQGTGDDFPDRQIDALIEVIKAIYAAYDIQGVTGHEDVAPGRKTDPGPNFPWERVNDSLS